MIGTCYIMKYGSILNFIRERLIKWQFFKELFKCSLCMGFWIGLVFGLINSQNFFYVALYSAAVCWVADHFIMIAQKHLYGDKN